MQSGAKETESKRKGNPIGAGKRRLKDAVGARGKLNFNLWYVYSPKNQRDWVLDSDLAYDYYVYLESHPDVASYDLQLEPELVKVGPDNHRTTFDANVLFRDGRREEWEFKYADELDDESAIRAQQQRDAQIASAEERGSIARTRTNLDLEPFQQRLQNWRRMLAPMSRARDENISVTKSAVAVALSAQAEMTIGDLVERFPQASHPHLLASIFTLLQEGSAHSDVDQNALSPFTKIRALKVCDE